MRILFYIVFHNTILTFYYKTVSLCRNSYNQVKRMGHNYLCIRLYLAFSRIPLHGLIRIGGFHVMSSPPCWWTETKDLSLAALVRPPAIVHFSIVMCVSRDWLQTIYRHFLTLFFSQHNNRILKRFCSTFGFFHFTYCSRKAPRGK